MTKRKKEFVRCCKGNEGKNCFANKNGLCMALYDCPFYRKSKTYERDLPEKEKPKEIECCKGENGLDCFANNEGFCTISRACSFYKTKEQYEIENPTKTRKNKINKSLLSCEQKEAIEIAKDLGYSFDCIERIAAAKNSIEIQNALADARKMCNLSSSQK